jgi:hypothetical protein
LSLLTIFSAPKPFLDPNIDRIQRNAIGSWQRLENVQVMLMGNEDGLADAAREAGALHIPDVQTNDRGTPLISSMVQAAREQGDGELLCIINADMILMEDFVEAFTRMKSLEAEFVLLSRRWDLGVQERLGFESGWQERLLGQVRQSGRLHRPAGSDFFLFPRNCYSYVPDFAVGRAGWDNWMIYQARRQKWPVVDATPSLTIVHQNHDYRHLPDGKPHYAAPETEENVRLAGGVSAIRYTILDATHILRNGRLEKPPLSYPRLMRGVEVILRRVLFFLPPERLESIARPKRWKKRMLRILGRREL